MMKTIEVFVSIALSLIVTGCEVSEVRQETLANGSNNGAKVFTADFETVETRTYVDRDLYMYWNADDSLSIFTSTYNEQYRFDGKTGDTGGSFSKVYSGQFVSGNPINNNYGVYPYNSDTRLTKDEKIELYLPQVQPYAPNTFCVGANTMVAVTNGISDTFLPFKNVCGYLVVKLYGKGKVKSVIFEGNNGEKISGGAIVTASHDGIPVVTMTDTATTNIVIDCGEGAELGKGLDESTDFWFVIPPTTFEKGFKVSVIDENGHVVVKNQSASKTIKRNTVYSMIDSEIVFDQINSVDNALDSIGYIHMEIQGINNYGNFYGQGGYPTFCLCLAFMSDDVFFSYDSPIFKDFQNWSEHRDLEHQYKTVKYYWDFFYRIIDKANRVLKYIDNKELCPGDDSRRSFVKGQALAYRAFCLFQLTQAWGERYDWRLAGRNNQPGVIILTEEAPEAFELKSVEECYAQINKDLDNAIVSLSSSDFPKRSKADIDIWVAKGLKSRVLLTMGKWAEAAMMAEDIVNNSGAVLHPSTYSCGPFNNQMSDARNTEWLWGLVASWSPNYDDNLYRRQGRLWHDFISNRSLVGFNRASPRTINCLLYSTIPNSDVRKNNWAENPFSRKKGNVFSNTYTDGTNLWVPRGASRLCPWMSQKWLVNDNTQMYWDDPLDVPYMRISEMMLIAAEGYAKSGHTAKSQLLLYNLGHFRDPSYVMPTDTGDDLVEKILWQRRVELWAEAGLRWLDLKRLNLPCDRGPKPREGYNQGGSTDDWSMYMSAMPVNLDPEASNYNMCCDVFGEKILDEDARYIPAGDPRWQWIVPTLE